MLVPRMDLPRTRFQKGRVYPFVIKVVLPVVSVAMTASPMLVRGLFLLLEISK